MRIIMHIDVNNAFLSWTALKLLKSGFKVDIRNTYAVIGGNPKDRTGIVLAKSTPAKALGVVTGETLYQAKQKCPTLKVYPGDYTYYEQMSEAFLAIIRKYTSDIEQFSIDECFIDYTKVANLYGDPLAFATKLQQEIKETLGFTVNIGIANNKLCAKVASDFSKPNKIHTCYDTEVETKLWPLDVNALLGIGKSSTKLLYELKIHTVYDLAHTNLTVLEPYFKNRAKDLIQMANGYDDSPVVTNEAAPKGIGNEITLDHDIKDLKALYPSLLFLASKTALRLREAHKYAYTIVVTLKNNQFKRFSHQRHLANATNATDFIYEEAKTILKEMWTNEPIRLVGIRLDNLVNEVHYQVSLFEDLEAKESETKLETTIDQLKHKYGLNIINKASLNKK